MRVAAIIAAGGRGERAGGCVPKQFALVGGRPLLERSLLVFEASPRIDEIVVVVPAGVAERPPAWLSPRPRPVRLATGGPRRQDSVARGLDAVGADVDLVVIHDAARPFVTADLIARTIDAAAVTGAAIAALPARDTVKQADTASPGLIARTLARDAIFLAQTPQAFRRDVLARAIARAAGRDDATDEAALVELAGHPVRLVEGDPGNIKITTPEDFDLARARLGRDRSVATARVGIGYDLHRLVAGRPLVLGGVTVPFERGLAGHSDADALCHAVTDAILGAAGAADIGRFFPDSDPQWRDASSLELLRRAVRLVRDAGFSIANVDAVVVAERPRIAPFADAMRAGLALALDVDPSCVNVKGKTNEGLGEVGRGKAIAVHATALLQPVEPDRPTD
jgi:2-C-methyl-D-erythritol 4-phosphate cytidylyltransferase/2-C-methyl-D-erythritol 2,4-cyclodiphosphate synthase